MDSNVLGSNTANGVSRVFILAALALLCACSNSTSNDNKSTVNEDAAILGVEHSVADATESVVDTPVNLQLTDECLSTTNGDGIQFCYLSQTRTLAAFLTDNTLWWSFNLPGDNLTNRVEGLYTTDDKLVIVADTEPDNKANYHYEVSSFYFHGEFIGTRDMSPIPIIGNRAKLLATALSSYVYFFSACSENGEMGTAVQKLYIPKNYYPPGGIGHGFATASTNCVLTAETISEVAIELPDTLILNSDNHTIKIDAYTLQPAIEFSEQPYSLERRTLIRDWFLEILSNPSTAYPNVFPRVLDRIKFIKPDDGQPYSLDCSDKGTRSWDNWNFPMEGNSVHFLNCQSGTLLVSEGLFLEERPSVHASRTGTSRNRNEKQFVVTEFTTNQHWQASQKRIWHTLPIELQNDVEFTIDSISYTSERWGINIGPSLYTERNEGARFGEIINLEKSWSGRYSREDYNNGTIEAVDINLTTQMDEDGEIRVSGYLFAEQSGKTTQSFRVEVDDSDDRLVLYTVTTNGQSTSLLEHWINPQLTR